MTSPIAGIDPHQHTFTIAVIDPAGVEIADECFENTGAGFTRAAEWLNTHSVQTVGIECSASWGAHVAVALAAAGFDCREVPPTRSSAQRRARRLAKTDIVDAYSTARALLAEPTLGPAQALEIYDPLVALIEAVVQHRTALVAARTLLLQHIWSCDQPTPNRDTRSNPHQRQDRITTPSARTHHR